jgi:hypothetical protein
MMDPAIWFAWIKVAAFITGLCFGGFAVGTTSWVWLRKQLLTAFACWLATLGTVMIGMSIWQSIQIEGAGFNAILAKLEENNERLAGVERQTSQLASATDVMEGAMLSTVEAFDKTTGLLDEIKSASEFVEMGQEFNAELSRLRIQNVESGIKALMELGCSEEEARRIITSLRAIQD